MEFEPVKQPFKVVEIRCETEKDYNDFEKIVALSQPRKPILADEQVRYVTTYEEVSGDYALDIPFADGSVNTIYFNSKRNAETVKHIIEVDGSKPNEATVCDMQEIKHGSWEYDSEGVGYANYLCSECGNFLTFYEDIDLYPYCPYCGAKMDKECEK